MRETITPGLEDFVHTLHDVLERGNSLSRCQAARGLEHLEARDQETRTRLIALLLDPEPDVRIDVADALGKLGFEDATEALIKNLKNDPDGDVRIQSVIALSRIKSGRAIDALVHCLSNAGYPHLDQLFDDMEYNASNEVHSQALDALGEIGDPALAGPVIELLKDETYGDLQESGFAVLAQLNSETARAFLLDQMREGERRGRRRAIHALANIIPDHDAGQDSRRGILEAVTEALLDQDPDVRISAAKVLGDSNHLPAVVPLTLLLSDPVADVRKEIISVLGKMRGPEIVNRLLALLEEANGDLKPCIARALGEIGDPRSLKPLTAMLDTKDENLLGEVIRSLGKIGEPGPKTKIAEILENTANPSNIRVEAAQSLRSMLQAHGCQRRREDRSENVGMPADENVTGDDKSGASDFEDVLENALLDKDDAVRLAAMSALVDVNPEKAVGRLTDLLRGELNHSPQASGSKATGTDVAGTDTDLEPEEQDISAVVEELLVGKDAETSTLASIMANPAFNEPALAEEPVQARPESLNRSAKLLAARLLGQIPGPGPEAIETLEEISRNPDIDLRREAYLSLGRIAEETSLPVVLEGLVADNPLIRLSALEALGGFRDMPQAGEKIAELLDDPDPYVRKRAVENLSDFAGARVKGYLLRALQDDDRDVCRAALRAVHGGESAEALSDRITDLIFEFSGELREEAAVALRKVGDTTGAAKLLAMLKDDGQEDTHWICIDALSEFYATHPSEKVEI